MSRIKEAFILGVAVLGLGAFLYCAMMHTKDRDRVVSVKGLSEREVKADYVIWPIVFKEVGNDLVALYESVQRSQRYVATVVMTVASKDVEKLREIMGKQGELLKQGIAFSEGDYRYRKIYTFNGLNDIKPEMIDEANKNARAAAQKFAADSESKLGKIKTATQGQFSIEDRDENTPFIKKVRVVTSVQYFLED